LPIETLIEGNIDLGFWRMSVDPPTLPMGRRMKNIEMVVAT
jgi:hypothetical protein